MLKLEDVCSSWNDYPNFMFCETFMGPRFSYVYKQSNCYNTFCESVFKSVFWNIYEVKSKEYSLVAGLIFLAKGRVVRFTEKAISSCKEGNSYDYISSLVKTKPWSFKGIELVRYESAGEVITDLGSVMGVNVLLD